MKFSPLFWPIELKGSAIYILDETLLPHKIKYIKATNEKQAIAAIKDMKTRAVGQVILVFYIFLAVIKKNKNKKDIKPILFKLAEAINSARPTLSFKYLTDMVLGWAVSGAPLEKSILGFLALLKNKRIEQAQEASMYLNDGDTVLTHCNISGQMPLIAEFAKNEGKTIKFFATETRPYLQGSRLTAWELQKQGFDVTLISDNMVAQVMHEKKINKVIVGADHLAQNGDIANKIGTFQIAILSRHFGIPFYVLCPPASRAKTGKDITIEIRPEAELLEYQGLRLAPKGVKGYYPAFDITPNNLITRHIYLQVEKKAQTHSKHDIESSLPREEEQDEDLL
ncbi:MAG: S-methyl-5-thioribose-1-phosphate isomerase [Candidatus Omnitrophica bacterium]|nr:S-methyl-5-thioribose-1-phosphate isomerase [Candidatus Omnitrophota bacterium]